MRVNGRVVVLAVLAGGLLAFPLGVIASHQFDDVPDTNLYHNDIDAIADAGVTTGCGGGNYCPSAFVTREQMAAFMNRLGALGAGKTPVVNADKVDGLTSGQFLRSDVAADGMTSCTGNTMVPAYGNMGYSINGSSIFPTSGDHWFYCGLHLPDGATMTSFEAHIWDVSTSFGGSCELFRTSWTTGALTSVAAPAATSNAGAPGYSVSATTSFAGATVDNDSYNYWVECGAQDFDSDVAIYGARVFYTVAGLPLE